MKKIGLSMSPVRRRYGWERAMEICKKSGFDAIDFNLECYNVDDEIYGGSEDAFLSHFAKIKEKANDLELEISQTHGRCRTYLPDDEENREWFHRVAELDLKATSVLGSPACVQHFINNTRWGMRSPEELRAVSCDMFANIVPYAEKYQTKIALETFGAARVQGERIRDFFADPYELKKQFEAMNTAYKTVCVDTGHTHEAESFWVPPPEETIRILGKDISILHLHDNTGHWDDHLIPGMGNINWPGVFDALDEVGYSGVYNCELRLDFYGNMLEEAVGFIGRYMRKFVDEHGSI